MTTAVHQTRHPDAVKAAALRLLSTCLERLVVTITGLIIETLAPSTQRLRDAQRTTAMLRDELERLERQRGELDSSPGFATRLPRPVSEDGTSGLGGDTIRSSGEEWP